MAKSANIEPELVTLPDETMAVVHTSGDPNELGPEIMKALYGAAFALKSDLKKRGVEMKIEAPRARWTFAPGKEDVGALEGWWGLPVPHGTRESDLVQKSESHHVSVEHWTYGTCARILHCGGYDEERPTIERLHSFIAESGQELAGVHEEWYFSSPSSKVPRTLILYPVRAADGGAEGVSAEA
jgi:hypothetical protein